MFKVVRDFVPQPQFLIWCDCSCGTYVGKPFTPGPAQVEDAQQIVFIQDAIKQGWKITLEKQICPNHVAKAKQDESLIVIPKVGAAFPHRN